MLLVVSDKVYQLLAHGRWFSDSTVMKGSFDQRIFSFLNNMFICLFVCLMVFNATINNSSSYHGDQF
jgi:hypothetical protein